MEYCYSKLATPDNLYTYGGLVLGCICEEIASHDNFIEHFESLFRAGAYDVETVNTSLRYYVKVFGNLRAKDLARKYNARLSKTTTVGLRQRLATKGPTKKPNKRQRQSDEDVEPEPTDEQTHDALMVETEIGISPTEFNDSIDSDNED